MQSKEELISKGRTIREDMSFEDLANEGSKRENIRFLWCLKDRSRNNSIVGFKLLALDNITYMSFKLKPDFENLLDCDEAGEVTVEKGNSFVLTLRELVWLSTKIEYAGKIGGLPNLDDSYLRIACKPVKDKNGRMYMFPTFVGEGFKLGDKAEFIQDDDGNIAPEYREKFGVIATREEKILEVKDDEARDIAAAFRIQYSSKGMLNNVL